MGDGSPPSGRLAASGPAERLRALACVEQGRVWALGLELLGDPPAPAYPDRPAQRHVVYRDWSHYERGDVAPLPGGVCSVDDGVILNCHGGTHLDALGHIIAEGTIAGGLPATTTVGGLAHADVAAIARVGIVCRAIVADVARFAGGGPLPRNEQITLGTLQACLEAEGVTAARGDMLLLRTGSLLRYQQEGAERFFREYSEPGLSHEEDLLAWVDEIGILGIGSDTLANELPVCPATGAHYPLHRYLLRDRGLQFHEALWLEDVAAACAADRRYAGLYVAAPLKLVGCSGSPINPLFVR